jgi:16S rRNA (uracil1498-N3)-methyltransferase
LLPASAPRHLVDASVRADQGCKDNGALFVYGPYAALDERYVVLPRFHIGSALPLSPGMACELPEAASRHIQVLRMQPGGQVQLFDGLGGEWIATVTEMGRKVVSVAIGEAVVQHRELPVRVTLAMGMPANDRMDALVEKACELGVFAIQPLLCERSVLRLDGDRAAKKVAHWQAVAVSACEQSGRSVVPQVHEVRALTAWLKLMQAAEAGQSQRGVLSLREAVSIRSWLGAEAGVVGRAAAPNGEGDTKRASGPDHNTLHYVFLSGPEGGLSPAEEELALAAGWAAITLGPRVLRADTAPLAALSVIGSMYEG